MTEEITVNSTSGNKLITGWFTFTCSEDSTILLTELLNDNFDSWVKLVDFKYIRALKTNNVMDTMDVAFIEGAVSSQIQEEEIRKIREKAKYVVAIGACACTGLPSATRNQFTDKQITERMDLIMKSFNYGKTVKKLADVITVDDMVPGCPMNAQIFKDILTKYLKLFKIL